MSLNIVVNADVAAAGRQIQDFSKQSRIALTNLSLIAQDLPFGFIGIQNNLPGLIQSFSNLKTEAGGVGGALKALGSSLIGPGGLFLAFSTVTAGITFAIKEYGSLGNAINALTSSNKFAVISQNAYNKELANASQNIASEEAKIRILVGTLTNLKKPLSDRQNAYAELKKIQPDIVRGITEENALTAAGTEIIKNNSAARIQYIKLKAQEAAVSDVINKNAVKQLELEQKVLGTANNLSATRERIDKLQEKSLTKQEQELLPILIEREKALASSLTSVTNEYNNLNSVNDTYLNKLDKILGSISGYDNKTQDLIQTLKDQKKAQNDLTIGNITQGVVGEGKVVEDINKVSKAFAASRKIVNNSIKETIKLRTKEFKEADVKPVGPSPIGLDLQKIQQIQNEVSKFGELTRIEDKILQVRTTLEDGFFRPLQNSFTDFLTTGKFTFKEFGKTVLDAVARITARLAASGLAKLLANLLAPGIGGVIAGAELGGAYSGGGFLSGLANTLFGGVAAPSFGGINGGGMEMGGQVNLVLRGADLVGSINRTNAQILRTG